MSDVFVAPVWLGTTLLLVRVSWLVGQRLFPHDALGPRLMHTIVLSWACIVGVATLLGSMGWLSPGLLLAGVGTVAGLAWWCCRSLQEDSKETAVKPLPFAVHNATAGRMSDLPVTEEEPRILYAWQALWGFVLAWIVSWTVWGGLLRFPDDWDTLNYHLPLIVQWLHRGNLYVPDEAVWFVPGNNELLGLWLVGPFSGDFLIALINLPSVLLLAAGTVELARSLGMARPLQHLTALAVLATWPVLRHLTDAENDVAVAGLFMTVLTYGVRYARQGGRADLALSALSLGLLAGVKYYALGYAGVAGTGLVLLWLSMRGLRATGWATLLLVMGACLWGGYWYARNLCLTGTPIYPQGITPSNDLLKHIRTSAGQSPVWRTTLLGNGRREVIPLLRRAVWRMSGPCHATACLFLPAVVAWLIGSGVWLLHRTDSRGFMRIILAFSIVGAGLIWGVTPFAAEASAGTLDSLRLGNTPIRYGLCFLSLCVVGLALALQELIRSLQKLIRVFLSHPVDETTKSRWPEQPFWWAFLDIAFVYVSLGVVSGAVVYQSSLLAQRHLRTDLLKVSLLAFIVWLAGMIGIFLWNRGTGLHRALPAVLIPGVFAGAAVAVVFLSHHWHAGFAAHYESQGWNHLSATLQEAESSNSQICALTYRYYPLFGSRRQFRVYRPYWVPSYEFLLDYLHSHETTLVVAFQNGRGGVDRYYGNKCAWLHAHPELFPPIEDGSLYFVCRVNRPQLTNVLEAK